MNTFQFPTAALRIALLVLCSATAMGQTSNPGPYKVPMKPTKLPAKGARITASVPSEVEAAIKAAPKTGDIYSVTQDRQTFPGQILKVDVLVFQEGKALVMTNFSSTWVAIVAKKVQFVAPEKNNAIATETPWNPLRYSPPPQPGAPGRQPKAAECLNGGAGVAGSSGVPGHVGDAAPRPPKIYLVAGAIVNKHDDPLPEAFNFIFDVRGYSGGEGANGGQGAAGGGGGDGGPSDWHDPGVYPFDPGCKCGAGYGGPGSTGGRGAPGGMGGDASAGADMTWVATQAVLDSLYFSRVFNQGGFGGQGGVAGPSGQSGGGGARGEWEGLCKGGGAGRPPLTPVTPADRAPPGADKSRGQITQDVVNSVDRFY